MSARKLFGCLAIASILLLAPVQLPAAEVRQGFDLSVPQAPSAVMIGTARKLVYELHLTNFADDALVPSGLEVLDAGSDRVLLDVQGAALARLIGMASRIPAGSTAGDAIQPGARAVVYLEVPVPESIPGQLRHRLRYGSGGASAAVSPQSVEGGVAAVDPRPLPELGPPLRGGPWVAVYDPGMARGHRRVLYAVDGRVRIPGRFAIDWMKLDDAGRFAHGDEDALEHWYGYDEPVLAVADATVEAVRDDVAEPPRVADAKPVALGDASGNYVVLALGDGRYAFYEHLRPGSLKVKRGDKVRRGQEIAALGFTGQSTGPHLHFHVADAPAPLAAEGLPYLLTRASVIGGYESIGDLGQGRRWMSLSPASGVKALPSANAVVMFPDR